MNRKVWKIVFIIMFAIILLFVCKGEVRAWTSEDIKKYSLDPDDVDREVGSQAGNDFMGKIFYNKRIF